MEISSRYCKISGNFELPSPLENGHDYRIVLNGSIISETEKPDEQGGMEIEYRFRPLTGEVLQDNGTSVKLVDKTRKSVSFRKMIINGWGEPYDEVMNVLLANGEEVRKLYERLK